MAKMLMGQIDHARARVSTIKGTLIGKAPGAPVSFEVSDVVEGLCEGTLVFTGPQLQKYAQEWAARYRRSNSYGRPSFESVILEYAFTAERTADKKRYDAERAVYVARADKVNAEATAVEDAIVLGDNAAALAALTAFAAFTL